MLCACQFSDTVRKTMRHTFSAAEVSFSSLYNAPWMRNLKEFNDANISD